MARTYEELAKMWTERAKEPGILPRERERAKLQANDYRWLAKELKKKNRNK